MVLMRDAIAAAACECAVVALSRQRPYQQNRGANGKNQGAQAVPARFMASSVSGVAGVLRLFGVNPAKASNRLDEVRDLTKEPRAVPVWRRLRRLRRWRTLALAGLVALPCHARPAIVALPDGRYFAAAGDLAYVVDMPPDAAIGSLWRVYARGEADSLRHPGDESGPALAPDAPTRRLGTVELVSAPAGPQGIAIVTVVRSVRELTPGNLLLPWSDAHSDAHSDGQSDGLSNRQAEAQVQAH